MSEATDDAFFPPVSERPAPSHPESMGMEVTLVKGTRGSEVDEPVRPEPCSVSEKMNQSASNHGSHDETVGPTRYTMP